MSELLSALFNLWKAHKKARVKALLSSGKMSVERTAKPREHALPDWLASPSARDGLTQAQFRAFESAYETLIEHMLKGASGLAPDFGALERAAISHMAAAGWTQSECPVSDLSLAAHATVGMLGGYDQRIVFNALTAEDAGVFRQTHERTLERLRAAEGTADTIVRRYLLTHPQCGESFVYLYWRDEKSRTHTHFDIVLGFEPPFTEAMNEAMWSDFVFQTFRQSLVRDFHPVRRVTGGIGFSSRDGLATKIAGIVLSKRLCERLASEGLVLPFCILGVSMYERLL